MITALIAVIFMCAAALEFVAVDYAWRQDNSTATLVLLADIAVWLVGVIVVLWAVGRW